MNRKAITYTYVKRNYGILINLIVEFYGMAFAHADTHPHTYVRIPAHACGKSSQNVGIDGNGQWNRMGWHDMRACFEKPFKHIHSDRQIAKQTGPCLSFIAALLPFVSKFTKITNEM